MLGNCDKCWDKACSCDDGHGWMGYSLDRLKEISSSIDSAIKRNETVLTEKAFSHLRACVEDDKQFFPEDYVQMTHRAIDRLERIISAGGSQ